MKKLILSIFLLLCFNFSYWNNLYKKIETNINDWNYIQKYNLWSNNWSKVFDNILTNSNYFQSDTNSWNYVWFKFNSLKKINKYWILHNFNDNNFILKSFTFQWFNWTNRIDLDIKKDFIFQNWIFHEFEIINNNFYDEYRILIDEPWLFWVLITEISFFELKNEVSFLENKNIFNEYQLMEIVSIQVWAVILIIIFITLIYNLILKWKNY